MTVREVLEALENEDKDLQVGFLIVDKENRVTFYGTRKLSKVDTRSLYSSDPESSKDSEITYYFS